MKEKDSLEQAVITVLQRVLEEVRTRKGPFSAIAVTLESALQCRTIKERNLNEKSQLSALCEMANGATWRGCPESSGLLNASSTMKTPNTSRHCASAVEEL